MSESKQSDKFKRLARELECDESEERFDAALKKVTSPEPPPERSDEKDDEPGQ